MHICFLNILLIFNHCYLPSTYVLLGGLDQRILLFLCGWWDLLILPETLSFLCCLWLSWVCLSQQFPAHFNWSWPAGVYSMRGCAGSPSELASGLSWMELAELCGQQIIPLLPPPHSISSSHSPHYIKAFAAKMNKTSCSGDLGWLLSILPFLRKPYSDWVNVCNPGDQILLYQLFFF